VNIGVIGCGNISDAYLKNLARHPRAKVVAVSDVVMERAEAKAQAYEVEALTVEEMLGRRDISVILNLTVPQVHAEVSRSALLAGKHTYSEKPLALNKADAHQLVALAREKGLGLGSAPDTVLGVGIQTARKALDNGWIGRPVAGAAFMMGHGPENWHPNPDFFYQPGAGPLFDMGPYYVSALFQLLGPVARVTAMTGAAHQERVVRNPVRYGLRIPVNTPTHVAGTLAFSAGPIVTFVTSFDVWASSLPRIEIYGTEGTLIVPDPNTFGGPVRIRRQGAEDWTDLPLLTEPLPNARGIGLVDLVEAVETGREPRAGGHIGEHVVEVMESLLQSGEAGRAITIESQPARPAPMPGWADS
jgi:predicted dehydrogenase